MQDGSPADGQISVAVADDHKVVRAGLRLLLHREDDMHVVGEAGDVAEALRIVSARRPHVLVLDLNMPGEPSLPAIPQLMRTGGRTRVVVLTAQDDPSLARQALRHGASGYVLKEAAHADLVGAVRAAADGRSYVYPELGARLAGAAGTGGLPGELTEREVEILRLIALGHTHAEIAQQLFLSVRTVETHRAAIQQKLGRTTRAGLVRYALDNRLVS